MPEPLDDLKRLTAEVIPQLREGKPRTVLYLAYLDEGGTEISFLHAFADAAFETLRKAAAAAGVSLTVLSDYLGGFLRLRAS